MISSIDLFLRRDCALGAGPEVELPRALAPAAGAVDDDVATPAVDEAGCAAGVVVLASDEGPGAGPVVSAGAAAVEAVDVAGVAKGESFLGAKLPNMFAGGATDLFAVPNTLAVFVAGVAVVGEA